MLDPSLARALRDLATRRYVLIGVDFDGTLAPLVDDPMTAQPVTGSLELLAELAELPDVSVAVVSGRALDTLDTLTGARPPVVLIGSHGAESSRHEQRPDEEATRRLVDLDQAVAPILAEHPGVRLERKPTSLVLHTRGLESDPAGRALAAGAELAQRHEGVTATPGKDVLELAVTEAGKGPALLRLAEEEGADAVLYLGDDVTDERAFATLRSQDVTVRVGPGDTVADHRVEDEQGVLEVLSEMLRLRTTG